MVTVTSGPFQLQFAGNMWPVTQHSAVLPAETFRKVTASFSCFPGKDEIQRQSSFEKL